MNNNQGMAAQLGNPADILQPPLISALCVKEFKMSDVNEEIAREYFEDNGFLVRMNLKYYINRNNGGPGGLSDIDLLVVNLKPTDLGSLPFILTTHDLKGISKAAIEVKGWHTERITPRTNNFDRLLYVARNEAVEAASKFFGTLDFKKILIVSSLAISQSAKEATIEKLRSAGIDHIIEFKTVIDSLYESVETQKSPSSEILQTIRLIKIYRDQNT